MPDGCWRCCCPGTIGASIVTGHTGNTHCSLTIVFKKSMNKIVGNFTIIKSLHVVTRLPVITQVHYEFCYHKTNKRNK